MFTRGVLCALVAAALTPVAALGQWSDTFDTYTPGSINGQGGWKGWDGTPAFAGTVTSAVSLSAPNSQQINSAADSVHLYSGVTSGVWTYTARQYIPSGFTGSTYFILLNTYNDGGPYDWSVELQFIAGADQVVDDLRASNPVSFVRDAWAEIRVDFDLSANTVSQYYNGALIASGTWTTGTPSVLNLAAVDLFGGTGTNVFYDDMSLTAGATLTAFGLEQTSLGQATLDLLPTPTGDVLRVSNIGSTGNDGVSVDLGRAEGWRADFQGLPDLRLPGVQVTTSMRGEVDGVPDREIGESRISGLGLSAGAGLAVDFSGVGSTQVRADLYDTAGVLVGTVFVPNGAEFIINQGGTWGVPVWKFIRWDCEPDHDVAVYGWVTPICIGDPVSGSLFGDIATATFSTVNRPASVGGVSSGTITARGVGGTLDVIAESVQLFGVFASSLGDATLNPMGSSLGLATIGGTGQDGVRFDLGAAVGWGADLAGLPDLRLPGVQVTTDMRGIVDGAPDRVIGSSRVTGLGIAAGAGLITDFSGVGSTQIRAEFFDSAGTIIGTTLVPNGAQFIINQDSTWGVPVWRFIRWSCEPTNDVAIYGWVTPVCMGDPVSGTQFGPISEARFSTIDRPATVGGVTTATILARGVPGPMVISAFEAPAAGCPADLNGDGLVDFSDYLEFLNFYDSGDLRVDFNGDGLVDFSDYLEFLNHYDAGC